MPAPRVRPACLRAALDFVERYPCLGVRDAVHAATAIHIGIPHLISTDRVFDTVAEVVRVDPATPGSSWSTMAH